MLDIPYFKLAVLGIFAFCTTHVHRRGSVRLRFWRQLTDHSTFMAPINCVMYLFSGVPNRPFLDAAAFPQLRLLESHWESIRDEAYRLASAGQIKASDKYDDAGLGSTRF